MPDKHLSEQEQPVMDAIREAIENDASGKLAVTSKRNAHQVNFFPVEWQRWTALMPYGETVEDGVYVEEWLYLRVRFHAPPQRARSLHLGIRLRKFKPDFEGQSSRAKDLITTAFGKAGAVQYTEYEEPLSPNEHLAIPSPDAAVQALHARLQQLEERLGDVTNGLEAMVPSTR